jgi:hypothetical protein
MTQYSLRPFHDALYNYYCEFDAPALMARFQQADLKSEPGVIRNFLGARVQPAVHPELLNARQGTVEGLPIPGNWHADIAEWASALKSVEMAHDTYRILELGCGWGCWITNMGVAARSRGLNVELVGIDGDLGHLEKARATLALNGFSDRSYRLVHGLASHVPGQAIFPRSAPGEVNYGNSAKPLPVTRGPAEQETYSGGQILDCYSIAQLSDEAVLDLLHVDIQGAECSVLIGSFSHLTRYVRRVLVGTHSRSIEGELMSHFLANGWRLEMERPAIAPLQGGLPVTLIDGVQMWANMNHV